MPLIPRSLIVSIENIRKRVLELLAKYHKKDSEELLIHGYIHEFSQKYPMELINIICLYHDIKNQIELTNTLMKKWKSKENDLLKTLCEQYHEKYEEIQVVILKKEYSIGPKISTGAVSVVRECKKRANASKCALKVVNKKRLQEEDLQSIAISINIWRELKHPNIVSFHDIFESKSKICIIMEYVKGAKLIHGTNRFEEKNAIITFKTFVLGLKYLHDQNIVHGNINLAKILMIEKSKYQVKLAVSNKMRLCKKTKLRNATQKDMWCAGVFLYMMMRILILLIAVNMTQNVILICQRYFGIMYLMMQKI
eukprot:281664_1